MTGFSEPAAGGSDGQAYRFLDTLAYVRVPSAATDGQQSVVEMHLRAGHAPPMHIHEHADETIHVLDGEVTAHTSSDAHTITAGQSVVLPSGEPHSLVAESQAEILTTTSPGGFDEFVVAPSEPADAAVVPTKPPSETAIGRVTESAPAHGIDIVGPPPGRE
ncbi:cupin domain-containing protein [Haloarcula sp. S1CR25-12]|uniref:Cupin domain-containing protein n=1 Tax=Haloarcula saliterrae TaxID=2950534 RepID=A0ABU2FFP0_9EURY|nr:cupin domain-containing protein [Haloarcula sp. S1CR25-12]MDS0261052.1 cupin domain-containing protein [Haloarcula sp. S1CR25-12]